MVDVSFPSIFIIICVWSIFATSHFPIPPPPCSPEQGFWVFDKRGHEGLSVCGQGFTPTRSQVHLALIGWAVDRHQCFLKWPPVPDVIAFKCVLSTKGLHFHQSWCFFFSTSQFEKSSACWNALALYIQTHGFNYVNVMVEFSAI